MLIENAIKGSKTNADRNKEYLSSLFSGKPYKGDAFSTLNHELKGLLLEAEGCYKLCNKSIEGAAPLHNMPLHMESLNNISADAEQVEVMKSIVNSAKAAKNTIKEIRNFSTDDRIAYQSRTVGRYLRDLDKNMAEIQKAMGEVNKSNLSFGLDHAAKQVFAKYALLQDKLEVKGQER